MHVQKIWVLRGPNLWSRSPVLEVELDLQDLNDPVSSSLPGLADRLLAWLPTLGPRPATDGGPGDFAGQLRRGTGLAHVLREVALELQALAGVPVSFGAARAAGRPGFYRVVVEFEEEQVGCACLGAAREVCLAALHDQPYALPAKL